MNHSSPFQTSNDDEFDDPSSDVDNGSTRDMSCDFIEPLEDENEDSEATCPSFEIVTIPADFTVEGLVNKYERGKLKIPGFQRGYVWNQKQASRLIESLLLGLPVPSLFLYTDPDDGAQQVIDGQQRLLSVVKFYQGSFSNAALKKPREFKLIGLGKNSPYADCTAQLLRERHPVAMEKLNDAVMRAFIIKQNNQDDATSAYYIFERLNTGGTHLIGQEIRNCIYHGALNDMMRELNTYGPWRLILGRERADGRMRDIEMILRVISLLVYAHEYRKPMKDFLSTSMRRLRRLSPEECRQLSNLFIKVCDNIVAHLGEKPFHLKSGMHPAVFDAVFTTIAKHNGDSPEDFQFRYRELIHDRSLFSNFARRTTDADAVANRLKLAEQVLYGV